VCQAPHRHPLSLSSSSFPPPPSSSPPPQWVPSRLQVARQCAFLPRGRNVQQLLISYHVSRVRPQLVGLNNIYVGLNRTASIGLSALPAAHPTHNHSWGTPVEAAAFCFLHVAAHTTHNQTIAQSVRSTSPVNHVVCLCLCVTLSLSLCVSLCINSTRALGGASLHTGALVSIRNQPKGLN